jgi:hypothetical protein
VVRSIRSEVAARILCMPRPAQSVSRVDFDRHSSDQRRRLPPSAAQASGSETIETDVAHEDIVIVTNHSFDAQVLQKRNGEKDSPQ